MITDEDLILYHYRDGLEPDERARIGAALAGQPELAQRLQKLVNRLDAAAAIPEVPVPAGTMQRWRAALDVHARQQTTREPAPVRKPHNPMPWLAAAATVIIAIVAVMQLREQPATMPPPLATADPPPATVPESSAYERGLQSHLASTERQLASLPGASPEERARLVETIIEQNRIYAQAAERAGEPQLARVLRAFTPILENLQQGGGDASESAEQLAFELRVMQGRLGAAPASATQSTTL
jgi:hypothetical protein